MIGSRISIYLLAMLIWISCYPLKAQHVGQSTPLHLFFQANYDSTIIYHSSSSWNESPNYLIIAKQKEKVYFFTYVSPYREVQGIYYPGKLTLKFSQGEQRFRSTKPDTNRYFLPKPIPPLALSRSWRLLRPHQFWAVEDDRKIRKEDNGCIVDDGDEHTFYLIDKRTIRAASFYAPDFLEECVGPDLGRQRAIATRNILQALQREVLEH